MATMTQEQMELAIYALIKGQAHVAVSCAQAGNSTPRAQLVDLMAEQFAANLDLPPDPNMGKYHSNIDPSQN